MTAAELLAAITYSRLRNITICDVAILCALDAAPSITGREELARLTSFQVNTCAQSAAHMEHCTLIDVQNPGRPHPATYSLRPNGRLVLANILAGI